MTLQFYPNLPNCVVRSVEITRVRELGQVGRLQSLPDKPPGRVVEWETKISGSITMLPICFGFETSLPTWASINCFAMP